MNVCHLTSQISKWLRLIKGWTVGRKWYCDNLSINRAGSVQFDGSAPILLENEQNFGKDVLAVLLTVQVNISTTKGEILSPFLAHPLLGLLG